MRSESPEVPGIGHCRARTELQANAQTQQSCRDDLSFPCQLKRSYLTAVCGQEAQEFWRRVLEGVDRPVARAMMANLDLRHCMGIPGSSTRGRKGKAPLLPFYEGVKQQHPTKVLLVRVGACPPSC